MFREKYIFLISILVYIQIDRKFIVFVNWRAIRPIKKTFTIKMYSDKTAQDTENFLLKESL